MLDEPTVADLLQGLTWEQIIEDGIVTIEEVEAALRAKGLDPYAGYDDLYL